MEPTASSSSGVPAASGPVLYVLPSWSKLPAGPLEQHQFRAAVVPVVDADVAVLPAVLHPHRRADPLPAGQLRRGQLNLRRTDHW